MTNEDAQDKNGRRRSGVRKRLDFIRSWSSVGQEKRRRRRRRKRRRRKRRRRRNLGFVVVLVRFGFSLFSVQPTSFSRFATCNRKGCLGAGF